MPRVPTYDAFQAQDSGRPAVRFDAPQMPDVAGQRAQQLGQAMQQAGGAAARVALDMQEQVNQVRVDDALNQGVRARADLLVQALQLKGRDALEFPDGKSLSEVYGDKLQQELNGIGAGLSNDAQRQAFAHARGQMLEKFHAALGEHMVTQQRQYTTDTENATLSTATNQGVLLYGDEAMRQQSLGAITAVIDARAKREGWSPETRAAALNDAVSPLHLGIVKSLVQGGRAADAAAYLGANSAAMTIQARAMAQDMTKGAAALERAQAFADEVMGQGMGQADALALARSRFSGDEEVQAVHEVRQRFAEGEAARAQAAREVSRTAWAALMAQGSMSAIPPDARAALRRDAPEEERQMRDWLEAKWRRAKADAEGKAETDMNVYYELRRMAMDDPQQFAGIDLRKSQPHLKDGDLKHLIEIQAGIAKGDARAMESQRVLKQTLGAIKAEVTAIGIDLTPKEGSPQAQETAKFMGALTQALDQAAQAAQAKGALLTADEARRIGLSMVREGIEQGSGLGGWFQTRRRGYQVATDPNRAPGAEFVVQRFDNIPAAAREALVAEYRTRGGLGSKPLTGAQKDEIEREYTRRVQDGRIR